MTTYSTAAGSGGLLKGKVAVVTGAGTWPRGPTRGTGQLGQTRLTSHHTPRSVAPSLPLVTATTRPLVGHDLVVAGIRHSATIASIRLSAVSCQVGRKVVAWSARARSRSTDICTTR